MREIRLVTPELGLIAVSRTLLGVGIGLLVSGALPHHRRVVAGRVLLAIGALSTIPLGIRVFRRERARVANGHTHADEPVFEAAERT